MDLLFIRGSKQTPPGDAEAALSQLKHRDGAEYECTSITHKSLYIHRLLHANISFTEAFVLLHKRPVEERILLCIAPTGSALRKYDNHNRVEGCNDYCQAAQCLILLSLAF